MSLWKGTCPGTQSMQPALPTRPPHTKTTMWPQPIAAVFFILCPGAPPHFAVPWKDTAGPQKCSIKSAVGPKLSSLIILFTRFKRQGSLRRHSLEMRGGPPRLRAQSFCTPASPFLPHEAQSGTPAPGLRHSHCLEEQAKG